MSEDKEVKVLNLLGKGGAGGIESLCFDYARHSRLNNKFLVLWKPGVVSDEMARIGIDVEVYNTSPLNYMRDLIKFIKKCKRERIGIVVCHFGTPLIAMIVCILRIIEPKIRIVGYAHSNLEDWSWKRLYFGKIVYRHSDKIVCISNSVLNSIEENIGFGNKLLRIYNGVDIENFNCDAYEKQESKKIRLIYVGRLEKVKGVQNILMGLAEIIDKILFNFTIVGDGTYREELENKSKELGLSEKVTFLGTRRDIPQLLKSSDVFVHLPEWKEGFGITVIEAMAMGLICIVNDRGALPEIINDGVNGFVVGKSTGRDFAKTLSYIYSQSILNYKSSELNHMREQAVERAKDFNIEKYVDQMDNLLLELSELPTAKN